MKVSLCILTKNEIAGCRNDVPKINLAAFDEVFAVDAGSTDGTVEYLKDQKIPVYFQPKQGLNAACVYAFEKCNTDALVFFHPKGSVPVSDLEKFRNYFEEGYELVVASRIIKGAHNEEDENIMKPRKWFVMFLAIISAVFFHREGNFIWDVLHGFRGMTVNSFREISPADFGFTIDLEMVCKSYKQGIRRVEFPTFETQRLEGASHFRAWPTGKKLLSYLFQEMFS